MLYGIHTKRCLMLKSRPAMSGLHARRFQLWRELVNQPDFVRGSVVQLHRPCCRPECRRGRSGERHPATYLSFKQSGRTRLLYLPAAVQDQAREWVKNYHALMTLIEQICEVNRDILSALGHDA